MRWPLALRVGAIILALLGIGLGAVTIRALTSSHRQQDQANRAVTNYALAERSLQLDLLDERAGLLRNYDPINADVARGIQNLAVLRQVALGAKAAAMLQGLIENDRRQESLIDQFNSENARIQNALDYIAEHGAEAGRQLLMNRVLRLTLDTTPKAVREARTELEHMPLLIAGSPEDRLRFHASALVALLPHIDTTLTVIRALKMEDRIAELQTVIHADANQNALRLRRLETALTLVVLLLVVCVIALIVAQRSQTRELQAQAANERLSAAIATPLIDTGPGTFLSRVQEATDRLAEHIGARKLQLLIPALANAGQFSRSGSPLASDWLVKLAAAADEDDAWFGDRVLRFRTRTSATGALGQAMLEAGVGNLVLLRTAEPFRVIIGFEPEDMMTAQRRDHLAGLSSAIIAVAHGARRDMMERERERLEQILSQKRRMEKIGTIASGVAHNFNNIIGAIGGFAEMGQDITDRDSPQRRKFDEIQGVVRRAQDLIEAILTYARQRRSDKCRLDLMRLLSQSLDMLSAAFHGEAPFNLGHLPEHAYIFGSVAELQQVILNICNNAAQAGKRQPVDIYVTRHQLSESRQMSHGSLYPGSYVVITIADRGPGIPQPVLRQLFEPFFTTKAAGTGLGLSTAWEIIQDHAGTIHVENGQKGGAEFSVWLPEISAGADGGAIGKGARILLLCEPDQLSEGEDMLAELGLEPVGISLAEAIGRTPDLREVGAVVVSTPQPWYAGEIARALLPALDGRPLLLSIPDGDDRQFPASALLISYPIRPDQISRLLFPALERLRA